jgi:hypothetical protein
MQTHRAAAGGRHLTTLNNPGRLGRGDIKKLNGAARRETDIPKNPFYYRGLLEPVLPWQDSDREFSTCQYVQAVCGFYNAHICLVCESFPLTMRLIIVFAILVERPDYCELDLS